MIRFALREDREQSWKEPQGTAVPALDWRPLDCVYRDRKREREKRRKGAREGGRREGDRDFYQI